MPTYSPLALHSLLEFAVTSGLLSFSEPELSGIRSSRDYLASRFDT